MRARRFAVMGVLVGCALAGTLVRARQQGVGQAPSPFPLSNAIRERGSSITGAFEGWYYAKNGSTNLLVGYFNRNTKQEFDIPVGPNNHIDPGGPDQGQPTHFLTGRQWGVFTINVPKDFGTTKLTWTLVANGQTNVITLHTKAEYIVEPFEDAANKNMPPVIKFQPDGPGFTGPPSGIATTLTTTLPSPLTLTTWASDEGPKINVPENTGRGRGRGRGTDVAAGGAAAGAADAAGRGRGRDDGLAAAAAALGFTPAPPLAISWSVFRGPANATVKFDPAGRQTVDKDKDNGKQVTTATFTAPGDYLLRVQGNDSTGEGGGGFQCCWTNAYVAVSVKPAAGGTGGAR